MLELILSGCNGRMGRVLEALCADQPDLHIAAGFDVLGAADRGFPVFSSPAECTVSAQVVIDFSHPAALTGLLGYCVKRRLPVVLATTGYSEAQLLEIESAARTIPVFRSANFSLGINVLAKLARQAARYVKTGRSALRRGESALVWGMAALLLLWGIARNLTSLSLP